MQSTLRYMTKLDRAITNEDELEELSQFFESQGISALDLFKILKKVIERKKRSKTCVFTMCFTLFNRLPLLALI